MNYCRKFKRNNRPRKELCFEYEHSNKEFLKADNIRVDVIQQEVPTTELWLI